MEPATKRARSSAKPRLTEDLPSVQQELCKVDSLRGRNELSREERLDILRVYFVLVKDALEERARTGKKGPPIEAAERTAKLLGRSRRTVSELFKRWTDGRQTQTQHPSQEQRQSLYKHKEGRGNRESKTGRISHESRAVLVKVRDWVWKKNVRRERVSAPHVLEFLQRENLINIKLTEQGEMEAKDYQAALRAVQRYLKRIGFARGKRTERVVLDSRIVAARNKFLREIRKNRTLSPSSHVKLREVYVDESYLHEDYKRKDLSIDANDEQDLTFKTTNAGRRFCMVAAIQGQGVRNPSEGPSVVEGSVWTFLPSAKELCKGDLLCKNFGNGVFLKWFQERLLPNLSEPSLIILDNAKYHREGATQALVPSKMTKAQVMEELTKQGVSFDSEMTCTEARTLLASLSQGNILTQVEHLASAAGHRVLFLPSIHPDLNPMDFVWGHVKTVVGTCHSTESSLKDVEKRMKETWADLTSNNGSQMNISAVFDAMDKVLEAKWKEMREEELLLETRGLEEIDEDVDETAEDQHLTGQRYGNNASMEEDEKDESEEDEGNDSTRNEF